MSGFVSGLELSILSLALLFAWLTVAVFASAELAFAVGLGVCALWFFFFVPSGFIRELIWQSRQKKIMQQALQQTAPAYQPGTALPPPMPRNELAVIDSPASSGALDIYRDDLPQLLPQLEPRTHASAFKRSLVLPLLGSLMMIGASNDTIMLKLLEARGVLQKLPIAWDKLDLPEAHKNLRSEIERAARLTLRRETHCAKVLRGSLAAAEQFKAPADQAKQMADGDYVFEFYCEMPFSDSEPFMVWVTPAEMERGSFKGLGSQFTKSVPNTAATTACHAAANEVLKPLHATLAPAVQPTTAGSPSPTTDTAKPDFYQARVPFGDYARLVSTETLQRENGQVSTVKMSCWVNAEGNAEVRFFK